MHKKLPLHGSATVGFSDYVSVLEMASLALPPNCRVTFLADRGFEHTQLIHWLNRHNWSWYIRAKSDLSIKGHGYSKPLSELYPLANQVHCIFYSGNRCLYFQSLPRINPPPACASKKKAEYLRYGIEFEKIIVFQ